MPDRNFADDDEIIDAKPVFDPPWPPDAARPNIPMRNPDGTWAKGSSGNTVSTSIGQKVAHWFRRELEGIDPNDPEGKPKLQRMFENMFRIAVNDSASHMKEATWAFNALMDRAYGPPVKDRTELDAMAKQGRTCNLYMLLPVPKPVPEPASACLPGPAAKACPKPVEE